VEFHRSSHRHGLGEEAIVHAVDNAVTIIEIIWLDLDDGREVVIHAMPLRPAFHDLLPRAGEESL
jgi:hypothetical protein